MPIESVLRPILDTVLDAVVVMDRGGIIREWNSHAETMFGWSPAEAIGRKVEMIIPHSLREAHRRGVARYNDTGEARVLDSRLELGGLRRDGSEFPAELSITLLSREGRDVFVAFMRDISDRRQAEEQLAYQAREAKILLELSELASRDGSLDEVFAAVLDAICDLAGWPVGHAFLVADEDPVLRSSAWSRDAARQFPDLVERTAGFAFGSGVGLPGKVLESGQPLWVSRADEQEAFPRRGLGFSSAFAFPVFSSDRCIAVLEFFSSETREPEQSLLLSARAIGAQVGRVFERKRSEELRALLLSEIDHRVKNILSVVRGMAHLSFGSATDLAEAQKAFDKRLDSIATANDVLRGGSGNSAKIGDVVRRALSGCGAGEDRVEIVGEDLCIESSSAIMLALAIHELCTNALKYGALSAKRGTVAVHWQEAADDERRFELEWLERGGPTVEKPAKKGFGTQILGRGMELATGGQSRIAYEADGLRYKLSRARHNGPPAKAEAA